MKFKQTRFGFQIVPQGEGDEAFIEDTLGLRNDGDFIKLKRVNAMSLSCIAYLEAEAEDEPATSQRGEGE